MKQKLNEIVDDFAMGFITDNEYKHQVLSLLFDSEEVTAKIITEIAFDVLNKD